MEKQSRSRSAFLGGLLHPHSFHFSERKRKERGARKRRHDPSFLFITLSLAGSPHHTMPFHFCVCMYNFYTLHFSHCYEANLWILTHFKNQLVQSLKITLLGSFSSFHSCTQWDEKHSVCKYIHIYTFILLIWLYNETGGKEKNYWNRENTSNSVVVYERSVHFHLTSPSPQVTLLL